jgi:hypothetical protein
MPKFFSLIFMALDIYLCKYRLGLKLPIGELKKKIPKNLDTKLIWN